MPPARAKGRGTRAYSRSVATTTTTTARSRRREQELTLVRWRRRRRRRRARVLGSCTFADWGPGPVPPRIADIAACLIRPAPLRIGDAGGRRRRTDSPDAADQRETTPAQRTEAAPLPRHGGTAPRRHPTRDRKFTPPTHDKRSRPRGDHGAQLGDVDLVPMSNTPSRTAAF